MGFRANDVERLRITSTGTLDFKTADGVGINFRESGYINIDSDNNDSNRNFSFDDAKGTGSEKRLMILTDTGAVGFNTTLVGSPQTVHIAGDYKTSTQNVADEGLIFQSFTTASTGNVYPGISWSGNPNALGRARAAITAIATNNNSGSDLVFLTRNPSRWN